MTNRPSTDMKCERHEWASLFDAPSDFADRFFFYMNDRDLYVICNCGAVGRLSKGRRKTGRTRRVIVFDAATAAQYRTQAGIR